MIYFTKQDRKGLPQETARSAERPPRCAIEDRALFSYDSPWGPGFVLVEDGVLVRVWLPGEAFRGGEPGGVAPAAVFGRSAGIAARWAAEITEYFAGDRPGWREEDLGPELAGLRTRPFAYAVFTALLRVPAGATVAYGRLAEAAGHPLAARAVGTCMARNRLPIVLPCHRVVKADGALGQYRAGTEWKTRLLAIERGMRPA